MVPARSNTTNGMVRNRDREGEGESVVTVPQSAGHAIAQFPAWVRTLSWLPTETASQNGTALPSRGQRRKPANKCVRIIVRTYISCSSISRRSRSSLVLDVPSRCCECCVVVEVTEIPRGNFYFSSTVWCDFLAIGGHLHFNNASVIVVWSSRIVANVENIQYLVDQLLLADDY